MADAGTAGGRPVGWCVMTGAAPASEWSRVLDTLPESGWITTGAVFQRIGGRQSGWTRTLVFSRLDALRSASRIDGSKDRAVTGLVGWAWQRRAGV